MATIENVQNTVIAQEPTGAGVELSELENPFKVAQTIKDIENAGESQPEAVAGEKPEVQPLPPNEDEKEKVVRGDSILRRLDTLIESGLTQEEAQKRVYDEEYKEAPTLEGISAEKISDPQVLQWLNVDDSQLSALKSAYQNPPESALLFHLKSSPEFANLLGDEIKGIESLDLYEDKLSNAMFRMTLADNYKKTLGGFIANIENARQQKDEIITQTNKLQGELTEDFFKDFPELNKDDSYCEKMAVHFVYNMAAKMKNLSDKDCRDIEVVKKIYQSTKKDFKILYPELQKRFGGVSSASISPQLASHKLNQMPAMATEPSNIENAPFTINTDNDSSKDVVKILENLNRLPI